MKPASVVLFSALLGGSCLAGDVPRPANLTFHLPGGKAGSFTASHGKIVVCSFIFTTCPHCQQLTGALSAIARDYSAKGVAVLGIAFNDGVNDAMVQQFTDEFRPAYPVGWDDRASVFTFLQRSIMSPLYVPHVVIIDRKGMVRGDYAGETSFMTNPGQNIRTELDKLLAAPTTAAAKTKK